MIMDSQLVEAILLAEEYGWASPISNCLRCRLSSPAEQQAVLKAVEALVADNKAHIAYRLLKVLAIDAYANISIDDAGKYPAAT